MATNTSIEWADKTWSPIIGCDRVSPGCDNCYAIGTARIRESHPNPKIAAAFAGTTKRTEAGVDWSGKVNLLDDRLTQPLRWRKPARVFVNSMSDLFHDSVPDLFITQVFDVMEAGLNRRHTFQILTKRHARMRSFMEARQKAKQEYAAKFDDCPTEAMRNSPAAKHARARAAKPPANIWLGVSVENQRWADIRIPALLETPAAVRFLSCEPLLGPVWFSDYVWQPCRCCDGEGHDEACVPCADGGCEDGHVRQLHWVIAGGESGSKARAMHPRWVRSLRDQCAQDHVPFFMKQWGEWGPAPFIVRVCDPAVGWRGTEEELAAAKKDSEARGATHVHSGNPYVEGGEEKYWLHEMDHKPWSLERVGLVDGMEPMRRWGKKRAGRELDGRVHDTFPKAVAL